MPTTLKLPSVPKQTFESFMLATNRLELLDETTEKKLALAFQDKGDTLAANQLALSHLRFVAYIGRKYRGYGHPEEDIVQEGAVGLMKAIKRFKPEAGFRLTTYAVHWIKSEIHEYILRNSSIVRMGTTKPQRALFFRLRKLKRDIGGGRLSMTPDEISLVSEKLQVSAHDVIDMEKRMHAADLSLNTPLSMDEDKDNSTLLSIIPDPYDTEVARIDADEHEYHLAKIHRALNDLDARSKDIVMQRNMVDEKTNLKLLGEKYGISKERVRQIEKESLNDVICRIKRDVEEELSVH
jgi:RNA polymerase sigma-32 factor